MKTGKGQIIGLEGSLGSGIAILTLQENGQVKRIYCESAPTMRAVRSAFGDNVIGQWIAYSVDVMGLLESFEPMEVV